GPADRYDQFQPLPQREAVLVAKVSDGYAFEQLHHEVGQTRDRSAPVKDLRDIGMIHDGQGLPLRLEASNNLARIQPALEQLQSDPAANGLRLLSDEDNAKTPFTDLLKQLVRPNEGTGRLGRGCVKDGSGFLRQVEQVAASSVGMQQPLNLSPQGLVIATGSVQECPTLSCGLDLQRLCEDRFFRQ